MSNAAAATTVLAPAADVWTNLKTLLTLPDAPAPSAKAGKTSWSPASLLAPCGDGERTRHLTGLAGTYLRRGFGADETIDLCQLWNERNTPPLDADKVTDTCLSIAATHARNHPGQGAASALALPTDPATPLFDIADAKISGFLKTAPLPWRWVLQDFLPLGIVAAVVAPGGSSKSQLLMQLAYSVATGIPLAGHWAVGEQGGVLMLCAEDGRDEIHRRVYRMHQQVGLGLDPTALQALEDRLFIRSMAGEDVLLTNATISGEVVRTALAERLLLTAKQVPDLKLMIIDPASRFRGGDENSNADATRFIQTLEYVALTAGITILMAHHSHKGVANSPEASQNGARGASALTDGMRWQMALTPQTKAGTKLPRDADYRLYVEAALVKTNYTAPQSPVMLKRCRDGYLVATAPTESQRIDAQAGLLEIIGNSPNGITARQIEIQHGGVTKPLGISEREMRSLIEVLRAEGKITGMKGKPMFVSASVRPMRNTASPASVAASRAARGNTARRAKNQ